MIRVDRTTVPPPAVLVEKDGRGVKERTAAEKALKEWIDAKKDAADWTFKFAVYGDDAVKAKLEQLFHGKCAYCESTYGATQPMDVEHWRPKGQIESDGEKSKPAYYWLAATWENLLPSCIDCNRRRRQLDAISGKERSIGKADQFPLDEGSTRAKEPGQEKVEVPLLLNPCDDDPESELRFEDTAVVQPAAADGLEVRRARASIDVYALNRNKLVHARAEHVRRIRLRVARVNQLRRVLERDDLPADVELILDDLLLSDLRELARMRLPAQPYALLSRQLIDRWMGEVAAGALPDAATDVPGGGRPG